LVQNTANKRRVSAFLLTTLDKLPSKKTDVHKQFKSDNETTQTALTALIAQTALAAQTALTADSTDSTDITAREAKCTILGENLLALRNCVTDLAACDRQEDARDFQLCRQPPTEFRVELQIVQRICWMN
jgi:hypothetical protein